MWIVRLLECEQQQERSVFSENCFVIYDRFHNLLLYFLEVYTFYNSVSNPGTLNLFNEIISLKQV